MSSENDVAQKPSLFLPMVAVFLAGAVAIGVWQRFSFEGRLATFVKHCPKLSIDNHVALKTPEGRIVIISFVEIPEAYLPTFCPDAGLWNQER